MIALSKCCHADVIQITHGDTKHSHTVSFECSKCGKKCDYLTSSCCSEPVNTAHDWVKDNRTNWYVCTKCLKPCDSVGGK